MSEKWASDEDAGSLLAGILDETEDVAQQEKARLTAQIEAREKAEQERRDAAQLEKAAEAQARLAKERDRLQQAQERRTQKLEALRIEDLKQKGEWEDPAVLARQQALDAERLEAEADAARQERARDQVALIAAQNELAASPAQGIATSGGRTLTAVTALLVATVIAAVGVIIALTGGYKPDSATYSKAVFMPKKNELALVEAGATPIPTARAATELGLKPAPTKRPAKPEAAAKKPDKNDDAAKKRAEELQRMLDESDSIFGD